MAEILPIRLVYRRGRLNRFWRIYLGLRRHRFSIFFCLKMAWQSSPRVDIDYLKAA